MRLVPEREKWVPETMAQIPHLEIVRDLTRNSRDTFLRAMLEIGDDGAVQIEDDVILTSNFLAKIEPEIAKRPRMLQQFFSLRKKDAELGSRLMPGRTYLMLQCTYFPPGYASGIYDFYPRWQKRMLNRHDADPLVRDFLIDRKAQYWLHVPSLVQHRIARSAIDKRRSSKRQSITFQA